jgi:hypothetical protein
MLSLCSISSMVRGFWQTVHGNELSCYGSSEGSWMWSPINVVITQHIVHAEGAVADNIHSVKHTCRGSSGRLYTVTNLLVTGHRRGVG